MQVEMLKISSIYETISQAFLGRKDDDDNDFQVFTMVQGKIRYSSHTVDLGIV